MFLSPPPKGGPCSLIYGERNSGSGKKLKSRKVEVLLLLQYISVEVGVGITTPTHYWEPNSECFKSRKVESWKSRFLLLLQCVLAFRHIDNEQDNNTITFSLSMLLKHVDNEEEDGIIRFSIVIAWNHPFSITKYFLFSNLIADIPDSLSQILTCGTW